MTIDLTSIWASAGILLGFQLTSFSWRVARELDVTKNNLAERKWLPPGDFVNLLSMVISVIGVLILPLLGFVDANTVRYIFGLSLLLFAGYPFTLIGHYEMYTPLSKNKPSLSYFPRQEKITIVIIFLLALFYLLVVFFYG
jgi:hypothetical protein